MRPCVVGGVGVVTTLLLLLLVSGPAPCEAQGWEQLVGPVLLKLSSLWHDGEMEFLDHVCRYSHRPTIYRWQLYYKGKMWCPGWASFSGKSKTRSKSGAVEHAVRDFVKKAFERGLVTEEEASSWLNKQ